ncbi:MAG: PDZ domain-containing protein [Proteobacteria bacterium]|nr:PDZ domain-containing protein [Pseudomonadota bacterium]
MKRLTLGLLLTLLGTAQAYAETGSEPAEPALGSALGLSVIDSLEARHAGYAGGVRVEGVHERSAAKRAGLREGDVIVQLGGDPIRSTGDLAASLARREAGRQVAVKVLRNGRERVLTATPSAAAVQTLHSSAPKTLSEQVEVELASALGEGTVSWSLPKGTLVASLEDGPDLELRIDGEDDAQRLVIELDGRVVFDSDVDGEVVIDLELD